MLGAPRPLQLASASTITRPSSPNPTRPVSVPGSTTTEGPSLYTPPPSARAKSRRRHSSISYIHSGTRSKSPLSHPTSPQFPPLRQPRSPFGPIPRNVKAKRTSYGDSKMADAVEHLKERPPVTLAEKHAELLHFIAQKESKCLELRSQLATHEAELLQLKRKWELIVNRGFEKPQTWSSTSTPSTSPSPPFLSPSAISAPHAKSPPTPSSPYFPLAHTHAPVLEGIKEGVQGMSRLIAAGFETIAGVPIEPSPSPAGTTSHQPPLQPLLLRSTSKLDRKPARRHAQNESQSSSSSTVNSNSTSTFASDSAGATTNTSTTSIRSSVSFDGPPANKNEQSMEEQSRNSTPVSDQSEQVLMVRDTGATPTMSPNPDFERKQRSRKLNERRAENEGEFDPWLGGLSSRPMVNTSKSSEEPLMMKMTMVPSSLPPISTIPGLATMNLAGPAAQQVTSWMGSVGKRLGEIRDSPTFTKSQKRASILLTDMQHTFVSSLISLPPPQASSSSSSSSPSTTVKVVSQPPSLLDEFDEECGLGEFGVNTGMTVTMPVLVPLVRKSPDDDREIIIATKGGSESEDSESWNW